LRASKDAVQHRACGHPSRLAKKARTSRVNAIAFIPGMTSEIASPRAVMPSAVPVVHATVPVMRAGVALKWLAVPRGCERKSGILATIRVRSRRRGLALRVACELTQPRQAVVSALQAVGIIVGIIGLSGCRQCRECRAHKRRGSNELEHFIFSPFGGNPRRAPSGVIFERAGLPREAAYQKPLRRGVTRPCAGLTAQPLTPERAARRFVRSRRAVRRRPRAGSRRGLAGAASRLRHSVRNPWPARYCRPAARHSRSRCRPR
jgi:hypothetical protein